MAGRSCSFCGKHEEQVSRLVAGGAHRGTFICDECIRLCVEILNENGIPTPPEPAKPSGWWDRLRRATVALPR